MSTVDQIDSAVEGYMRLPYRMEVYWDDGYWAAEFPELPGLAAGHEDRDQLWSAVDDAKRAYFEAAIRSDRAVPRPREPQDEYSGNLRLRLPKSVHRQAAEAAEREGVSLNQFISSAVARELGRREPNPTQSIGDWIGLNPGWTAIEAWKSWQQLQPHCYAAIGPLIVSDKVSGWHSGIHTQGSPLEASMRYVDTGPLLATADRLGSASPAEKLVPVVKA